LVYCIRQKQTIRQFEEGERGKGKGERERGKKYSLLDLNNSLFPYLYPLTFNLFPS
jgi:hypothetical protein